MPRQILNRSSATATPTARSRSVAVLGLVLALVLSASSLVACRGEEGATGELPGLRPFVSADATLLIDLTTVGSRDPELLNPVRLLVGGPMRRAGKDPFPSLDWVLAGRIGPQDFTSRIVATGANAFVELGGVTFELGPERVARFRRQAEEGARRGKAVGFDPLLAVRQVTRGGTQKVAGAETTRYSGQLDRGRLLDELLRVAAQGQAGQAATGAAPAAAPALSSTQRRELLEAFSDPEFSLNVAEDGTLRRVEVKLPFAIPPARRAEAQGARGGEILYRVEYANVNGAQTIVPPSDAEPYEEFERELRKLLRRGDGAD